ncbi:hypothetical protein K474DRAFT_818517 [Panus rudis PR-1116 ss-1]|nr:hypothetical protein K474DRAFT_818517 [Panus rudis PR-1116 ss-1]
MNSRAHIVMHQSIAELAYHDFLDAFAARSETRAELLQLNQMLQDLTSTDGGETLQDEETGMRAISVRSFHVSHSCTSDFLRMQLGTINSVAVLICNLDSLPSMHTTLNSSSKSDIKCAGTDVVAPHPPLIVLSNYVEPLHIDSINMFTNSLVGFSTAQYASVPPPLIQEDGIPYCEPSLSPLNISGRQPTQERQNRASTQTNLFPSDDAGPMFHRRIVPQEFSWPLEEYQTSDQLCGFVYQALVGESLVRSARVELY